MSIDRLPALFSPSRGRPPVHDQRPSGCFLSGSDEGSALLTCRLASRGLLSCCALMLSLSTLDNPGWPTPAADVEAVLSTLPLPPDIDTPTFASAAPPEEVFAARSSRKKLVLAKPVDDGDLRSGFGMRRHPILGFSRMHTGVDWVTRIGAPILSAGDGAVIKAERVVGYGLRVEIQHADGVVTTYSHLSRFGSDIAPGTEVHQGQVIGFVGSTGLSTGPHLHYEVMVHGQFVDPMEIDVPEGASVAAKVEKTTSPADKQAAIIPAEIIPAERIAALQTWQSPAAKTSAALAAPLKQPSPKPGQSAEHTPLQRIAAAPTQHLKQDEPVPLPPIRLASLKQPSPKPGQSAEHTLFSGLRLHRPSISSRTSRCRCRRSDWPRLGPLSRQQIWDRPVRKHRSRTEPQLTRTQPDNRPLRRA